MDKKRPLQPTEKTPQDAARKPAPKPRAVKEKPEPRPADPEKKHAGGRPSKLTPALAVNIFLLARRGLTDKEIAQVCFVTEQTITNWKKAPEFFGALKDAKAVIDDIVEASLLQRATGYNIEEEKLFVIENKIVSRTVLKHLPPDTTAALAWLHNRRPAGWRQKIPELSNLADSIGSVLQQIRKNREEKAKKKPAKGR